MAGVPGMAGKTPIQRFSEKYEVSESGCWLWRSTIVFKGYGQFYLNGKSRFAHRASWLLHKGAIPGGLFVCHTCDVPRCVNPEHLFLGTNKDNMQDMARKGRGRKPLNLPNCRNGHVYTEENTRYDAKGNNRLCKECSRTCAKEYEEKKRRAMGLVPRGKATHCKRGHEFTPGNTILRKEGGRKCRTCATERVRKWKQLFRTNKRSEARA